MDLTDLPDLVLRKILSYLPFHERLRIGRVCPSFLCLSNDVISKTKLLHMKRNYRIVQGAIERVKTFPYVMSPSDLDRILPRCAKHLMRIQFDDEASFDLMHSDEGREFGEVLSRFSFPKLEYLDLINIPMKTTTFEQILRQSPNMRTLIRVPPSSFRFPDIVAEKLESITFKYATNDVLSSMIGRLPNLKCVDFDSVRAESDHFGAFFSNSPKLKSIRLRIYDDNVDIAFNELDGFWRLSHLKYLSVRRLKCFTYPMPISIDLRMIIVRFPNLIRLDLASVRCTKFDIADLAPSMTQLRSLKLTIEKAYEQDFDLSIRALACLDRLRSLEFENNRITSTTFATLVRSCPRLTNLRFNRIDDLAAGEMSDKVLRPFSGGRPRSVSVSFTSNDPDAMVAYSELNGDACKEFLKSLCDQERIKLRIIAPAGIAICERVYEYREGS